MPQIVATMQGEWHWICIVFEQICKPFLSVRTIGKRHAYYVVPDLKKLTGELPKITKAVGDVIEVKPRYDRNPSEMADREVIGRVAVTITQDKSKVVLFAEYDNEVDREPTERVLAALSAVTELAQSYRADGEGKGIRAERLIEYYYEAKEKGDPVTLAQLAKSYGYNESYLRQAHLKYKREQSQPIPNKKPNNGRTKRGKGT